MPRERSDDASLFDMLQAAEGVLRHTAGKTREDYERHELLRDAERFARQRPWLLAGIGMFAGLVASSIRALMKASWRRPREMSPSLSV